eukprot:84569-Chlamydomonas_euryale.AAC.1
MHRSSAAAAADAKSRPPLIGDASGGAAAATHAPARLRAAADAQARGAAAHADELSAMRKQLLELRNAAAARLSPPASP